jgi:hypothetical protein
MINPDNDEENPEELRGDAGLDLDEEDEAALDRAWANLRKLQAKNPAKFKEEFQEDEDDLPTLTPPPGFV